MKRIILIFLISISSISIYSQTYKAFGYLDFNFGACGLADEEAFYYDFNGSSYSAQFRFQMPNKQLSIGPYYGF
jgi:hypothetical protein